MEENIEANVARASTEGLDDYIDLQQDSFNDSPTNNPVGRNARGGSVLGTSTQDQENAQPLFVHTEQVEDNNAPVPSTNRSNNSGSTKATLLSARSTNSSTQSVSWGDSLKSASNKFGIMELPVDFVEFNKMCKKKIGNGAAMCIKKGCTISHRGDEVSTVEAGDILVQRTVDSVFLEPFTRNSNVTHEVLIQWLNSRRRLDEWSAEFAVANAAEHHEVLSRDDIVVGTTFLDISNNHKSPGMMRVRRFDKPIDTYANVLGLDFLKTRSVLFGEVNEEDLGEDAPEQPVDKEMNKVKESVEHVYSLLSALIEKLDDKDYVFTEEVKMLFARTDGMQTDLGTRCSSRIDSLQVPTIWGSIALMSGALEDLQMEVESMPTENEIKDSLRKEVDRIESNATQTVNEILLDLETRVATVLAQKGATNKKCENDLKNLKREYDASQDSNDEILLKLIEGLSVLKSELGTLRSQVRSGPTRLASGSSSSNCSNYVPIPVFTAKVIEIDDDIAMVNAKLSTVDSEFETVRLNISKLVADSDGESIKSFGLGFRDRRSSDTWLDTNIPSSFGLVVDAHLVFEHLFHMVSGNESTLKALHTISKLKLDNFTQSHCVTSFDARVPRILSSTSNMPPTIRGSKGITYFDRVPSYAAWDETHSGMRDVIQEHLSTFGISHQEHINSNTAPDSKGRSLATKALDVSILWIVQFISFIDDTYKGFIRQHTFSEERAWELSTQLGRRIFMEVSVPRTGVSTQYRIGEHENISRLLFWPMLRSHDIMKSYKDANYRDHPTIASEYVKFLTANSGSDITDKLVSQVKAMKEEVAASAKLAKAATSALSSAMNLIDEQKRKIAELEKRVTAIEKKRG